MELTIHDIIKITGMTRGQIDQIVSRHGLKLGAEEMRNGARRNFLRADAIRFAVIASLRKWGLNWDAINHFDVNSKFIDCALGIKRGDYPHEELLSQATSKLFLVVHKCGKGPYRIMKKVDGKIIRDYQGEIIEIDALSNWLSGDDFKEDAIIIDFSELLDRVDAALNRSAGQ